MPFAYASRSASVHLLLILSGVRADEQSMMILIECELARGDIPQRRPICLAYDLLFCIGQLRHTLYTALRYLRSQNLVRDRKLCFSIWRNCPSSLFREPGVPAPLDLIELAIGKPRD
jgi:hypothetical protein